MAYAHMLALIKQGRSLQPSQQVCCQPIETKMKRSYKIYRHGRNEYTVRSVGLALVKFTFGSRNWRRFLGGFCSPTPEVLQMAPRACRRVGADDSRCQAQVCGMQNDHAMNSLTTKITLLCLKKVISILRAEKPAKLAG